MDVPDTTDGHGHPRTDYCTLSLSDGSTVIYDPENPDGWIQSELAYDLTPTPND